MRHPCRRPDGARRKSFVLYVGREHGKYNPKLIERCIDVRGLYFTQGLPSFSKYS